MDGDIQRALDDAMTAHAELHEEVERLTNSLQQLKAEIAKEALSLELNYGDTTVVRMIAEHLRQLSAI